MPKLIIQHDGREWTVTLKDGPNIIGRSNKCAVPVNDTNLSREHCEIVLKNGICTLFDKESMNGTHVNGAQTPIMQLEKGDRITVGNTVIYFEEKPVGSAPPPVTQAAGGEGEGRTGTQRRTAPPETARKPAPVAKAAAVADEPASKSGEKPGSSPKLPAVAAEPPSQKSTRSTKSAGALIKDYASWGKEGFNLGRLVPFLLLGGTLFLGLVVVIAIRLLGRSSPAPEDSDNLIKNNPGFELTSDEGVPVAWRLRAGSKSKMSVDTSRAHSGRQSLAIEKSADAADLSIECEHLEEIPIGSSAGVEASAWTKFDTFAGWVAIKITWIGKTKGTVLQESYSIPQGKSSEWSELKETFAVPPGAGSFRYALALYGRSGRILVDDARVVGKGAGAAPSSFKLGSNMVAVSPNGGVQLEIRGKRVLSNAHLRLESDRYGSLSQLFARPTSVTPGENKVVVKGKLPSPVDFNLVDCEITLEREGEGTVVSWSFPGNALKEIDRVSLVCDYPRADRWQGLPEGDKEVSRLLFGVEELDLVLEFSPLARVQSDVARNQTRLRQRFKVDPSASGFAVGLKIQDISKEGLESLMDPERMATRAREQENFSEALRILKEYVKTVKEQDKSERIEERIRQLEDLERKEWDLVRAGAFRGELSRRPEELAAAKDALERYAKHWSGEATTEKTEKLRESLLQVILSSLGGRELERAQSVLKRAEEYRDMGKKIFAIEILQMLAARYPGTDVARAALKALEEIRGGNR